MFGTSIEANYYARAYPPDLLAEIFLNTEAPDGSPYLPTDRAANLAH